MQQQRNEAQAQPQPFRTPTDAVQVELGTEQQGQPAPNIEPVLTPETHGAGSYQMG